MTSSRHKRLPLQPLRTHQPDLDTSPWNHNLTQKKNQTLNPTRYPKMLRSLTTLLVVSFLLLLAPGTFADNHSDKPDLVDSLSNSIQNLSTCASCQTLLVSLTAVAHLGDDKFVLALLNFCSALGIQEPKVCRGVMGAQGPIIAHSLRSMKPNGQTSTLFCVKTFGVCDDPPVREWKTIPLPPKHTRKPQSPSPNASPNQKPLQVIHLSDLHIDREYTVSKLYSTSISKQCQIL